MARLVKLPAATRPNLRSEANQSAIRAGVIALVSLLIGAVVESASAIIAVGLTIGGLLVSSVYLVTALRASVLLRELPDETRRVTVTGWTRTPDGTNYAIYPAGGDLQHDPQSVLRVGSARDIAAGTAFLLETARLRRSAALIGSGGEVLGVGSLRSPASAARVWARRGEPSPWWVGPTKRSDPAAPKRR
jgi:hypothetical protein